jgi:hypothetical protein
LPFNARNNIVEPFSSWCAASGCRPCISPANRL